MIVFSQNLNKTIKEAGKNINEGKFKDALRYALRADSLYLTEGDPESLDYAEIQRILGMTYTGLRKFPEAEHYYKKAYEIFGQSGDQFSKEYHEILVEYSGVLTTEKKYTDAEVILAEITGLCQDMGDTTGTQYADALYYMGNLLSEMGRYSDAKKILYKAVDIWKTKPEGVRGNYPDALDGLGNIYLQYEEYYPSIDLFNQAAYVSRMEYGENSYEYAYSLTELGFVLNKLAHFDQAIKLYLQAIEIETSISKGKSEDLALYLYGIGNIYKESDDYVNSESNYYKALQIQKSQAYDASDTYWGLSDLYLNMGDFSKADEMIRELHNSINSGEDNENETRSIMNVTANYYTLIGSYDKALPLYLKLIENDKANSREGTSDYAIDLDNLGNLYTLIRQWEKAEPLALEALQIKRKNLGERNPGVLYELEHLSSINEVTGNYSAAENYAEQSIDISRSELGESNLEFGKSLNSLARIFLSEGKYNEAEAILRKSLELFRTKVGKGHPLYVNTLKDLAVVFDMTGKADSAEIIYLNTNEELHDQIRKNFSFLSQKEKENFIESLGSDFSEFNSFVLRRKMGNPSITGTAYNNQLALKGIVLQSSKALRQAIVNSGDKKLNELYDSYESDKSKLVRQEQLALSQRWLNADSLFTLSESKEKDLIFGLQKLPGFQGFTGLENNEKWEDVRNALGEGEAAIEFISFNKSFGRDTSKNIIYCALLLKPGYQQPEMISLFSEEALTGFLNRNRSRNDAVTADNLYSINANMLNNSTGVDNSLYGLIWRPLEKYLLDVKSIYYSPVGLLNTVSFDAIPTPEKICLSDKYHLVAVTSTREVIKKPNEFLDTKNDHGAVFYGGINYDSDTSSMKSVATRYASDRGAFRAHFMNSDSTRGGSFEYLEGTLEEVQEIGTIMKKYNISSKTFSGDDATEESFKSLNNLNSPTFLHIATHGFFFPGQVKPRGVLDQKGRNTESIYASSPNPLSRAGLILAGGNHAWKNQPLPGNVEDGILLASEVSQMYLPYTRLVALSACETGLGEIRGSEGVFGLRRAFKMAGVNFLIISLWQVPDYQTSELMTRFYEGWAGGKGIHESFRAAQDLMKAKYPEQPSAWAAFVLIE